MYGKRTGHTEWVTSVAHLPDGRVLSVGMDGKLCIWGHDRRTVSEIMAHRGSISKVAADTFYNVGVTCGYDKNLYLWKFGSGTNPRFPTSTKAPVVTFAGHDNPVLGALIFFI